jgi:hypothetical protein
MAVGLRGYLFGDDGSPQVGKTVEVFVSNTDGVPTSAVATSSVTDANGAWEFPSLDDDLYDVRITAGSQKRWQKHKAKWQVEEVTVSGLIKAADGTVGAPSIIFTKDPDTGLYRIGSNEIGVAVGGQKILDISATGLGVTGDLSVTGTVDGIDVSAHAHTGAAGQGGRVDHASLTNAGSNTHAQIDSHIGTATSHISATSAHGATGNVLGLTTADARYAPIAKGVTGGDAHDHAGGDGAPIPTAGIADDAVDDTKVGNRVPQFYRRQGGSATDWAAGGTNNYEPTTVRMQSGAIESLGGPKTIVFPTAFSNNPIVIANTSAVPVFVSSISPSQVTFGTELSKSVTIYWLAIGPE